MAKASARRKTSPRAIVARIEPSARIVVNKGAEAPEFREGTAVFKRVRAVLGANGKPVEYAIKRGARSSTVRFLAKAKVIRLVTKASAAAK